jgi:PAS domain S-box-containing protein
VSQEELRVVVLGPDARDIIATGVPDLPAGIRYAAIESISELGAALAGEAVDAVVVSRLLADDPESGIVDAVRTIAPGTPIVALTAQGHAVERRGASHTRPDFAMTDTPVVMLRSDEPTFGERLETSVRQGVHFHRTADTQRKLLVNISDTITLLDAEARIIHTTGQMMELLGRPASFWGERSVFELCHPDDRDEAAAAFAELLSSPGVEISAEFRAPHADGGWEHLEFVGVNLLNDPTIGAIVVTTRNVTDRARARQELAQERDLATARSEAKSEFVAGVVHELRSPLHVVMGLAELLRDAGLDDEPAAFVRRIHAEAGRLRRVLDDILDIAQIEARRMNLHISTFSVADLVEDVARSHQVIADQKGVAVTGTTDLGADDLRSGDPGRLHQILANLVGNAVKFTDIGTVDIEVFATDGASDEVTIQVSDTGIGIPAEHVHTLFEPFSSASTATSHLYGGSGLGLSISRQLVELMGGATIDVSTMVGHGSRFSFSVPLPVSVVAPATPETTARPRDGADFALLVVEDNTINQQLITLQLDAIGHSATVVGSGEEALQVVFTADFDAVLMDRELPGIDGLETTRRIRRRELGSDRRIPVIAITASAMSADRALCLAAGMDDFLSKPVSLPALDACLARWLDPASTPDPERPSADPGAPDLAGHVLDEAKLDRLVRELGGPQPVVTALETFLRELPGRTTALHEAIAASDELHIRRRAHNLRSPSATLGVQALAAVCEAIEGAVDPAVVAATANLDGAIAAATAAVQDYLDGVAPGVIPRA